MKYIYVFDMGHVILRPANLKEMYEEAYAKCDYKTFKDLFYKSDYSTKVYDGTISDDEFFTIIKDKTHSKKSIEELKKLYLKYKGGLYESTIDIIKRLKEERNKICLLSNLKVIDYEYLSSIMDMSVFDKVYLSYIMHLAKPDKKIYEEVIKDLGTNNFYFFDDSIDNVNCALDVGINAFNVTGENVNNCLILRR